MSGYSVAGPCVVAQSLGAVPRVAVAGPSVRPRRPVRGGACGARRAPRRRALSNKYVFESFGSSVIGFENIWTNCFENRTFENVSSKVIDLFLFL